METADYSIPLRSLPNGNHTFSFNCEDSLFTRVENALADGCNLHVEAIVHKNDEMMTVDFNISGTVRVQCVVCLDTFDFPIEDCNGRMTFRLSDHYEEVDDELVIVDDKEERLDLAQWIYEMTAVMIPINPEHPLDENGLSTCNQDMLDKLDEYIVSDMEEVREKAREANKGETDPRWDALKSLLDKDKK